MRYRVRAVEKQVVDYWVDAPSPELAEKIILATDFHERAQYDHDVEEDTNEVTEVEEVEE